MTGRLRRSATTLAARNIARRLTSVSPPACAAACPRARVAGPHFDKLRKLST